MELTSQTIFDARDTLQALKEEAWPSEVDYSFGKMIGRLNKALDDIEEYQVRLSELQTRYPDRAEEILVKTADLMNRGFDDGPWVAIKLPAEVQLAPNVKADLVSLGLIK